MDGQMLIFLAFAAVALASAVMMVTRRNLVHSALYLIVTFFAVAAIYVLLHAEFLGAIQVLVYAGGIMVLFLFVILLVERPRAEGAAVRPRRVHVAASAVMTALVAGLLAWYFLAGAPHRAGDAAPLAAGGGNLETLADAMFRSYLLPFEAVSILLLVALVGAVVLARPKV
jgi:NADH-quinone oxidoreductase subunit J